MKILIACTLYPPYVNGGAEVSTALLAEGLVSAGHVVYVLTTGDRLTDEERNGVRVHRIRNKNIYWRYPQREKPLLSKTLWHFIDSYNFLYKAEVENFLEETHPDIVHSGNLCGLSTIVWQCAKERGIPIVHTLRDYYLLCPYQTMCKNGKPCDKQCLLCKGYSILKKKLSQKVDAVVGISNYILSAHLNNGLFANARYRKVIANSVNMEYSIGRQRDNKTIGYLGRISPEKGIEFLIESFEKSECDGKTLLIAGSGDKSYVELLIDRYERQNVKFVGKVDAQSFLSTIDLLVVPSLWKEPFGRVVIEAYSHHVPVFMANNGGLQDLSYEGIGWKFDTSNHQQLVSLLNQFNANKLEVNEGAFEKTMIEYTSAHIVEEYEKVYKCLL